MTTNKDAALRAELAELEAANEAATSWGAAVGARHERIVGIKRQLARAPAQEAPDSELGTWDEGCDFALEQVCKYLKVDPANVTWDAATETVDGDIQAVINSIMDEADKVMFALSSHVPSGQKDADEAIVCDGMTWKEVMYEIANRASNMGDPDAVEWLPSIYSLACEASGEDPAPLLKALGFDGNIKDWPTRRSPGAGPVMDYIVNGGDELAKTKAELAYALGTLDTVLADVQRLGAQVEEQQWRPIDATAKGGNNIELWHQVWKCPVSARYIEGRRSKCKWVEATNTTEWPDEAFTHWRPLSARPSTNKEKEGLT